jgi:hypothetical protein
MRGTVCVHGSPFVRIMGSVNSTILKPLYGIQRRQCCKSDFYFIPVTSIKYCCPKCAKWYASNDAAGAVAAAKASLENAKFVQQNMKKTMCNMVNLIKYLGTDCANKPIKYINVLDCLNYTEKTLYASEHTLSDIMDDVELARKVAETINAKTPGDDTNAAAASLIKKITCDVRKILNVCFNNNPKLKELVKEARLAFDKSLLTATGATVPLELLTHDGADSLSAANVNELSESINTLQIDVVDNEQCPICFYDASEVCMEKTPCGHLICENCLEYLVENNKPCHMCRQSLWAIRT